MDDAVSSDITSYNPGPIINVHITLQTFRQKQTDRQTHSERDRIVNIYELNIQVQTKSCFILVCVCVSVCVPARACVRACVRASPVAG